MSTTCAPSTPARSSRCRLREGRGTVLVGGRYSYTAFVLTRLSPDTMLDYWDYQARVTYDVTPNDRLGVFAFGSYDYLGEQTPTATLHRLRHRVSPRRPALRPPARRARLAAQRRHARTRSLAPPGSRALRARSLGRRAHRARVPALARRPPARRHRPHARSLRRRSSARTTSRPRRRASRSSSRRAPTSPLGARGDLVIDLDSRFTITPGRARRSLRLGRRDRGRRRSAARLAHASSASVWPCSAPLGIAHQPPAFVVPLPGISSRAGLQGGLQQSIQESVGLEFELGPGTIATATVFHNAFFDMSDPLGSIEPIVTGCAPGQYPTGSLGGDLGEQPDEPSFCGSALRTRNDRARSQRWRRASGRQPRRPARRTRVRGAHAGLVVRPRALLEAPADEPARRLPLVHALALDAELRESYATSRRSIARTSRTRAVAYDLGRRWRAGTRLVFYTGLPKAPDPTDPDSTRLPAFLPRRPPDSRSAGSSANARGSRSSPSG